MMIWLYAATVWNHCKLDNLQVYRTGNLLILLSMFQRRKLLSLDVVDVYLGMIANQMPVLMSLLSLERLFRSVVIPSCTYGLIAISNQLRQDNYEFLDVVQERLVKLQFGVSKFVSTLSLVSAVG